MKTIHCAARVKALREERAWTQQQLAEVADLDVRTVQRVEAGRPPSPETLQALAAAFDVRVPDLLEAPARQKEELSDVRFLLRITHGKDLLAIVGGAHLFDFDHDEVRGEEADLIGGFLQELQDWGDIFEEIEVGDRVRAAVRLTELIEELEQKGFWVFSLRGCINNFRNIAGLWDVAHVAVLRTENPRIISGERVRAMLATK